MTKQRETAVLAMSDLHFGKATATYNPDVFRKRLARLGERLGRIHDLLSDYEFDELVIACLGDANDGTDIYATQPHHQAISNVEEQAIELARLLDKFGVSQADVWGKVRWECVPGNHGRSGARAAEAANWDIVAYRYLAMLNRDDRVQVHVPEQRHGDVFLRLMRIYNHGYLLYHGHDIRSYATIPWYGMSRRLMMWSISKKVAGWQVGLMGHFHTSGMWRINRLQMLLTGTMVTDDEWALRTLGWESSNSWWLFGASRKRPITWTFELDLVSNA